MFGHASFSGASFAGEQAIAVAASSGLGRRGAGRRRSYYVEIDGQRISVEGYDEAERLLNQLKKEEKKQETQRKTLTILLGKATDSLGIDGALYRKTQAKVEVLEQKMDQRQERIESLHALIMKNLEEISEDDEEVLLLS